MKHRSDSGWRSALRHKMQEEPRRLEGTKITKTISAREGLDRSRSGNRRSSRTRETDALTGQARRNELAAGQEPFAIILGRSDSRVPAELVFDQGLGDLFVIRVAGNIVASSLVGGVEFAASRFGTRLVVVLGHSQCGAVLATLEELQRPTHNQSRTFDLSLIAFVLQWRHYRQQNSGTMRRLSCGRRFQPTFARLQTNCDTDPTSSSNSSSEMDCILLALNFVRYRGRPFLRIFPSPR